jgi:hypothetical protein
VRQLALPFLIGCLSLSFTLAPVFEAKSYSSTYISKFKSIPSVKEFISEADESRILSAAAAIYDKLELGKLGLSPEAMQYAYKGYQYLTKKGLLPNDDLLTICDFSQKSNKKRMYIIDMKNEDVVMNTWVAHGKNSGIEYATKFSNKPESLQSSLGFYVTKGTYFGKHGLSLRVAGLDKGFNDKAESRAIVIHGAEYIGANRYHSAFMGRSFGCPAVPTEVAPKVINTIKNGTCLFIYHPSKSYLHGSRILNG